MMYACSSCSSTPQLTHPQWQAAYDSLATYVHASEPTTKTYYFGIPIDYAHNFSSTTSMFAFEVYGTREDLYDTHLTSPAMQTFLEKIPSASTTGLDLNHYRCVAGFLDASGRNEEAGVMQDVRISCTSPEAMAALLPGLKMLVGGVDGSGGTLTYMAFRGLDDEVSARIYGRWKTREDMEAFIRRADVNGFWMQNKEHVRAMEQRLYVPNGKGWLHRGSGYAGEKERVKAKI